MKKIANLIWASLALMGLVFSLLNPSASADEISSVLIEKLERVQAGIAPNDPSKVPVSLRLADLLAERAREAYTKDLESGCTTCTAGRADRKRALAIYRETVSRAQPDVQPKIHIQMGHLLELQAEDVAALNEYQTSLRKAETDTLKAEAHLSIAEINFRKQKYAAALPSFEFVQGVASSPSRGHAAYRRAWCLFHLNQHEQAISQLENVLQSKDLLSRTGAGVGQANSQFQDEVARDYVTFMSQRPLKAGEIEKVYNLASEKSRLNLIQALAFETERLGFRPSALEVWNFAIERIQDPQVRLRATSFQASLLFDQGRESEALVKFSTAMNLRRTLNPCATDLCKESQKKMRTILVNKTQREKGKPTANLLAIYKDYYETFPEDLEIAQWGAQVARQLKDYPSALSFLSSSQAQFQKTADKAKVENILLQKIEVAEESGQPKAQKAAYEEYLRDSVAKTKQSEILYQRAQIFYDEKDYQSATDTYYKLVMDKKTPMALRKKSADLALDALVLLKDDARLSAWAGEFAKQLPDSRGEFEQIQQKTILTNTANLAKTDANAAWASMAGFDISKAQSSDRIQFLKNKIVLAEKTNRWLEGREAAEQLLRQPGLSPEDKQLALSRKAYFAEMQFDLKSALESLKLVQAQPKVQENRSLKLVLLAKAVGENPSTYLEEALVFQKDNKVKASLAAEIVENSKNPVAELKKREKVLQTEPAVHGALLRDLYCQNGSKDILHMALTSESLKSNKDLNDLRRLEFIREYEQRKASAEKFTLNASKQKLLASSMKARVAMLDDLDKFANRSIDSKDWFAQILSLDLVARQSRRFYEELMSLPMPTGLKEEEQGQYMSMLSQQAAPYLAKADQSDGKLKEFWSNTSWVGAYEQAQKQENAERLIQPQLAALSAVAPADAKVQLDRIRGVKPDPKPTVSPQARLACIQGIQRDPKNVAAWNALLELEKQGGREAMVSYIEARIQVLKAEDGSERQPAEEKL